MLDFSPWSVIGAVVDAAVAAVAAAGVAGVAAVADF